VYRVRNFLSFMLAFALLFGTATLTSAQSATPTPAAEEEMADEMNIVETAIAAGSFTTLVAAVQAAGLVDTLSGEGPFTVFAPTDDAFAALPDGTIDTLLADPSGALTDILLYHVVVGEALSTDLSDGMTIETVGGGMLTVSISDAGVMINDAMVVTADIMTSNGVIHVIDAVLVPAAEEEMAEGADATPTPAAEEEAEAEATPTPAAEEEAEGGMAEMNIVETAINAGAFTTLVAAVDAAGLVETLSGEGPFTVFAPTDDAFAALPDGTIDSLLADPSGALTEVLLYHVVSGKALSTDLSDGMTIETVGGGTLTVSISNGTVMINDATVVTADVMASNGVIHVIDTVLVPAAEEAAPEATATPAAEEEVHEPEMLPVTGGSATDSTNSLPWVMGLFAAVVAGAVLFFRRRMA
jgi:transforming growth factor-beta-induced protein